MGSCWSKPASNPSFSAVPSTPAKSPTFYENKNVYEWTVDEVCHWIHCIQEQSLNMLDIEDQFRNEKICGLKLMGINEPYLKNKLDIPDECISFIISKRNALISNDVNTQSVSSITNQPPRPTSTSPIAPNKTTSTSDVADINDNTLEPPTPAQTQKNTSSDAIATAESFDITPLGAENSGVMSEPEQDDDMNNLNVKPLHIEISGPIIKKDLSLIAESTRTPNSELDQALLHELVQVGTSVLSEHYSKSMSAYDQHANPSPRRTEGGNGQDDKDNKTNKTFRPQITQGNLLEAKSKEPLNADAKVFIPQPQQNLNITYSQSYSCTQPFGGGYNNNFYRLPHSSLPNNQETKPLLPINELEKASSALSGYVTISLPPDTMKRTQSAPNPGQSRRDGHLPPIHEPRKPRVNMHSLINEDESKYEDKCKWKTKFKNIHLKEIDLIKAYRAKNNIVISRKLTEPNGIIDNLIIERIPNLYQYMDLCTVLHYEYLQRNKDERIRIFDYDFHRKSDGEKLYCVAVLHTNTGSNKTHQGKWIMNEELYTKQDIGKLDKLIEDLIPQSVRESSIFKSEFKQCRNIEQQLTKACIIKKLMSDTAWHKISIKSKKSHKIRRILAVGKQEFMKRIQNVIGNKNRNLKLIPIISFKNGIHIEYVQIINIMDGVSIGISYNNLIQVTSIYVNKNELLMKHHLVSPEHIKDCQCFSGFNTNIDVLAIGNPDDLKNKYNALDKRFNNAKQEIIKLKEEKEEHKKEIDKLKRTKKIAENGRKQAEEKVNELNKQLKKYKNVCDANVGMSSDSSDSMVFVNNETKIC